jgi:hypothetical protein
VPLIRMRNPWDKEQYSGPYKDSDPFWNDADYRAQVNMTKANDGLFFMDVASFKDGFGYFFVNHYNGGLWKHTQAESINDAGTFKTFKLIVPSAIT